MIYIHIDDYVDPAHPEDGVYLRAIILMNNDLSGFLGDEPPPDHPDTLVLYGRQGRDALITRATIAALEHQVEQLKKQGNAGLCRTLYNVFAVTSPWAMRKEVSHGG